MTNRIATDNFSAHEALKQRKFDTRSATQSTGSDRSGQQSARSTADVERAQERLIQETKPGETAINSFTEAQSKVSELRAQFIADPRAGLNAQGRANSNLIEAAMTRPTA